MIESQGLHRKARIATRIWVVMVAVALAGAAPATDTVKDSPDLVKYWQPVRSYLNKYGYMTPSPAGADDLRTEEKLREAIRKMQKYGAVPQTGIVDAPTLELLQKKRCGMPDLSPGERFRRYAIQGQSWNKKNLTWSIKLYPPSLQSGMVRMELSKAFKVWSDVSQLNFIEVRSLTADIVISFERGQHGDGYAFDGKGVVLAHAFFPGEGIGGDAHFDAEEPWMNGEPAPGIDGVRLFAVAAHEFGHSLGLSHSSVPGALMNPFYQIVKDNFQLPYDDTYGIQRLYGARNPTRFAPTLLPHIPPPTTTTTTKRVVTTTRRPSHPSYPTRTATPPRGPTHHHPKKPLTCNTTVDAVSVIRRELFFFKGKYFWRLNNKGLMGNYPVEFTRLWNEHEMKVIDAVYERPVDSKIVFFSGAQYWIFDGVHKLPGYPRPLTDLGLPPDLKKIDAAMVWGYNGKTYLFAGTQYWRYEESEGRVELDYPRDMSMWRGVPKNLDAAFQHTDGRTYFFKGRKFYEFHDNMMKVKKKYGNINQFWFGCPIQVEQAPEDDDTEDDDGNIIINQSESLCVTSNLFLLLSFGMTFLFHRMIWSFYL